MSDILVIGSLNADLVVRSPRFPEPGETISGEDLQIIPGGKGANQAVAAARQGANVAMIGRVGSDSFGPFLLENLKNNHVDASHVVSDDSASGTAIIVVDANGQNSIVLSAGANGRVSSSDVDHASALHPSLLLLQLEIPIPTVLQAAQYAKSNGVHVILNPAPAHSLPAELISLADFIIPNESELALLTGLEVKDTSTAEQAAKVLLTQGAKNVIVTLGGKGALIVTTDKTTHIPSHKVDVVDTTAAGDAFIGGFAARLLSSDLKAGGKLSDMELQRAVRHGCACGAFAVTRFGAQPSLPTKEEIEQFLS
jgi:ribokinase